jgi:hypothetical protein
MGGRLRALQASPPPPGATLAALVRVRANPLLGGADGLFGGRRQRTLCFRSKFEHSRYADGLRGPSSASFGRYEAGGVIAATGSL